MAAMKTLSLFFLAFIFQIITAQAEPFDCGCGGYGAPVGYGCSAPVAPAISFAPVPQPVPIKIPAASPPQSVTIPNIILALLPPTPKAPVVKPCPPPAPRPRPIVIPIPQPYPVTVPDCGCA